jgi:glutamate receptor, ionotropic, invertebrate
VDCSLQKLPQLLEQAQQVGIMSNDHSYIVMNPDFQTINIDAFKHGGSNITGMYQYIATYMLKYIIFNIRF